MGMKRFGGASGLFIIAEAGVNHNGSFETACALADAAKMAGADAVKFQTFRAEALATASSPKAEYQQRTTGVGDSQLDMLRQLELSYTDFIALDRYCRDIGIMFLSTPFDPMSLDFLVNEVNVPLLKFSSGDITNAPFLLQGARSGKPIILSTGMSTLAEVEEALGILSFGYSATPESKPGREAFKTSYWQETNHSILAENVCILHCVTEYPTPLEEVNLRSMVTLAEAFGLPVGFSDHTMGIGVSVAAVALGGCVIEKHLTLDRAGHGPDHAASLEPEAFRRMVEALREAAACLGSPRKLPAPCERKNLHIGRRSLVARMTIASGEKFTPENIGVKRPGGGQPPINYWDLIGKCAERDYLPDDLI